MSELIYIPDNGLIINLDQVISVEFYPAHDFQDDEFVTDGSPVRTVHVLDKLAITTTALEVATEEGYDGDFKGCASKSKEIKIVGKSSKRLFHWLKSRCIVITKETMGEK